MKQITIAFFVACLLMLNTVPTLGHGVRMSHTIDGATGEITVTAAFDTGEVLDEAAVVIFAPDDLINPWSTGVMDETGSYTFLPDYTVEGFWGIQVRKAGHGGLINVEITSDMMPETTIGDDAIDAENATIITLSDGSQVTIASETGFTVQGDTVVFTTDQTADNVVVADTSQSIADAQLASGFTTAQIVIMSLSVIWGFIGTALYFMRRKPEPEK